jgi:hypothetical protein
LAHEGVNHAKLFVKPNEDTVKMARPSRGDGCTVDRDQTGLREFCIYRAWATVVSLGVASNYLVTLEVTGRKSGRIVSFPLVMVIVDGQRYLVSMLGDNVQWVHNVRASSGKVVLRSGGREEVQFEEIPTDQRTPILKAYPQIATGAQPHVPVNKDAAVSKFEMIAAAFPVFRLAAPIHIGLHKPEAALP